MNQFGHVLCFELVLLMIFCFFPFKKNKNVLDIPHVVYSLCPRNSCYRRKILCPWPMLCYSRFFSICSFTGRCHFTD
ncbi:hypothetical protein GLYMA_01G020450v4 [Glycine max]|nr:hypothetical protein GLYMA_01G020450v4 [Glycine max]KAH1161227.1 hypothetical protein GYH30_000210 [Glycine max]